MDLELSDKRALVVGGSRGIGRAIAFQLAREGAAVAIAARERAQLDLTAAQIGTETGARVLGVQVDTRRDETIGPMVGEIVAAFGGIDILVNCAAGSAGGANARFDAVTAEILFEQMDSKTMGYLRCIQAVAPLMIAQQWGRIINLSGLGARRSQSVVGTIRNVAVAAMTKNLADELGPHHINVTVVHPGATRTEKTPPGGRDAPANLIGRMPDASEVANVVTFLASPRSVAINGDAIGAGGGMPGIIIV